MFLSVCWTYWGQFVDSDSEQELLDSFFLELKKDDVYVSCLVMHMLISKKGLEMGICSR